MQYLYTALFINQHALTFTFVMCVHYAMQYNLHYHYFLKWYMQHGCMHIIQHNNIAPHSLHLRFNFTTLYH